MKLLKDEMFRPIWKTNLKTTFSSNESNCMIPGYDNVAKLLIENGANVNAKRSNGNTALHLAAYFGRHIDI